MNDLATMSDAELAAKCKRNRLEEWLHGSGLVVGLVCGLAVAGTIITLSMIRMDSWSWCFTGCAAFFAFFYTVLAIYGLLNSLARFRCRRFLRELEHRYGCRPLSEYVRTAIRTITSTEIVLILTGRTLPIGQNWWVSIRIEDGASGKVEARFGPFDYSDIDFGTGRSPNEFFKIAKGVLDPEVTRRLAEFAGRIQKRKTTVWSMVKDGFPISCALVFGGTKRTKIIRCNLAGIRKAQEGEPHVALIRGAFYAGRVLIDAPSGFGSCEFGTGKIQIGDV